MHRRSEVALSDLDTFTTLQLGIRISQSPIQEHIMYFQCSLVCPALFNKWVVA